MIRLQSELLRLYLPSAPAPADADVPPSALIDSADRVRAMVMELTGPPSWEHLSKVWHGVQDDLELPAPGIAVSGIDGLQLWFSLAEPVEVSSAHSFLEQLRSRFLPDVKPGRVRLMPAPDASAQRQDLHARLVPSRQEQTGNWSAFVAPDLAPVFAETPWLDIPPGEEGQAALLRGLKVTKQAVFEAAVKRLAHRTESPDAMAAVSAHPDEPVAHARPGALPAEDDPKRFLLRVMNDDTAALALRIEAAKALLQHSTDHRPPQDD